MQKLRDHRCQLRLLHPAKLSITIDRDNKIFQDKTRFKQYLSMNLALQKVLEGKVKPKEISYTHKNTDNRYSHISKFQRREMHTTPPTKTKRKISGTSNHWSLISINISGLNSPIKRQRLTDQI